MSSQQNKSYKGFTIIEVVLVLAIAGLIFLMVFVALPALQRSQRDTQRKDDMGRLITAIQNYQSSNKNKVPNTASDYASNSAFYTNYLLTNGDTFADPSSNENYIFDYKGACEATGCPDPGDSNGKVQTGHIYVYTNATCDGDSAKYFEGAGRLAFVIDLEGASYYCANN